MKVSELEGAELDYWVAKAEGKKLRCGGCGWAESIYAKCGLATRWTYHREGEDMCSALSSNGTFRRILESS